MYRFRTSTAAACQRHVAHQWSPQGRMDNSVEGRLSLGVREHSSAHHTLRAVLQSNLGIGSGVEFWSGTLLLVGGASVQHSDLSRHWYVQVLEILGWERSLEERPGSFGTRSRELPKCG